MRVILKISGEFLAGGKSFGYDDRILEQLSKDIISVKNDGISIGIVVGGGNIYRGSIGENDGMDRVTGDNIGMLATLQNSLVLSNYLTKGGCSNVVFSTLQIDKVARFYRVFDVLSAFEAGKVCLLAGGTGNPYFTTDTAAVLRAIELKADLVLKGTKVDGIYSSDPMIDSDADFFNKLSYAEALGRKLKVMDMTAFSLAEENNIVLKVFNITKPDNILAAIKKETVGTLVR